MRNSLSSFSLRPTSLLARLCSSNAFCKNERQMKKPACPFSSPFCKRIETSGSVMDPVKLINQVSPTSSLLTVEGEISHPTVFSSKCYEIWAYPSQWVNSLAPEYQRHLKNQNNKQLLLLL